MSNISDEARTLYNAVLADQRRAFDAWGAAPERDKNTGRQKWVDGAVRVIQDYMDKAAASVAPKPDPLESPAEPAPGLDVRCCKCGHGAKVFLLPARNDYTKVPHNQLSLLPYEHGARPCNRAYTLERLCEHEGEHLHLVCQCCGHWWPAACLDAGTPAEDVASPLFEEYRDDSETLDKLEHLVNESTGDIAIKGLRYDDENSFILYVSNGMGSRVRGYTRPGIRDVIAAAAKGEDKS